LRTKLRLPCARCTWPKHYLVEESLDAFSRKTAHGINADHITVHRKIGDDRGTTHDGPSPLTAYGKKHLDHSGCNLLCSTCGVLILRNSTAIRHLQCADGVLGMRKASHRYHSPSQVHLAFAWDCFDVSRLHDSVRVLVAQQFAHFLTWLAASVQCSCVRFPTSLRCGVRIRPTTQNADGIGRDAFDYDSWHSTNLTISLQRREYRIAFPRMPQSSNFIIRSCDER
jgi:hypothetical protein